MATVITPVIMCGGSGTRLWPRSRSGRPKPFLDLVAGETLFEEAVARCREAGFGKPVVVTGAAHVRLVHQYVSTADVAEIVVEPEPRQTAAAVAVAAMRLPEDRIIIVCPSDHHIGDTTSFATAARAAAEIAGEGALVCLSVTPTAPETRFGYVQLGEQIAPAVYCVEKFHEKPDLRTAEGYLKSGEFAWNAGIFVFRAGDYMSELKKHRPRLAAAVEESISRGKSLDRHFFPEETAFSAIEPESLDYAVMENTDRAATVTAQMDWSDVGDWPTLRRMRVKDTLGNAIRGPAELVDCRNTLVETDGPKVHMIGVEDVIVVVDGNDILVTTASNAHRVSAFAKPPTQ